MSKILIIDDDPTIRLALKRTLQNQGYEVTVASNGLEGIAQAEQISPALIICDWMMSDLNGLEVCHRIKTNPKLSTTFFILLTAKGEVEDRIAGLDAGADEFLCKPLEMNELKARVRAGLRLHQLNQDLQTQKQALEAELTEAANYVRSLLPLPLVGTVTTEALFVPSAQLGGDCFDCYWLDDDNLVIYLLDVSGHGVGSALLSVSILNVLRSQSLPKTNFRQPSEVLKGLNHAFPMEKHGDKYFTIWYGVYHRLKRQLIYANAGHPPAVILSGQSQTSIQVKQLGAKSLPIGFLPDADFNDESFGLEANNTLYVFSDGAYEIHLPDGKIWGFNAFTEFLKDCTQVGNLEQILLRIMAVNAKNAFDDDLSLLKINFG